MLTTIQLKITATICANLIDQPSNELFKFALVKNLSRENCSSLKFSDPIFRLAMNEASIPETKASDIKDRIMFIGGQVVVNGVPIQDDHLGDGTLHTKKLTIRELKTEDFRFYKEFFTDDYSTFFGGPKETHEAWTAFASNMGHWAINGFGNFAVIEKNGNKFIGSIGIWKSPTWSEHELGYWLLKRYQGQGFALEAAKRVLQYARNIKIPSIVSYIDKNNLKSINLAKKLGGIKQSKEVELLPGDYRLVYRYF